MKLILLTPLDLALASLLMLLLAGLTVVMQLRMWRQIVISSVRMTVQLLLIGFVLKALFAHVHLGWVTLIALTMLAVAGHEVMARQKRRLKGWWGYGLGTGAMFTSSFTIMVFTLVVLVQPTPWYDPQYAIPMLGMMLGNTMTGVALGMDRLTQTAWEQRAVLEQRLMLGQSRSEAILDIRRESLRTAMIPIINTMATSGLVSLPGMMTGQILSGSPPVEAVKYQILIMFLIASGIGFGVMFAVCLTARHLFDDRHRLRLERLRGPNATNGS